MSRRIHRIELIESFPSNWISQTSILTPKTLSPLFFSEESQFLSLSLDIFPSCPLISLPCCENFNSVTDLFQLLHTTPFCSGSRLGTDSSLRDLCNRVSDLEETFQRLVGIRDRKLKWSAEIKDSGKKGVNRKYKYSTEIGGGKGHKKEVMQVEIKGKAKKKYHCLKSRPFLRLGNISADSSDLDVEKKIRKERKVGRKEEQKGGATRLVEIEEPLDHAALLLQQAYSRRSGAAKKHKGKKKELSPQDAALTIQHEFRAYLLRRSQALRAFRELAVAKTKLKEMRASFNNFSYRRNLARNAEERQRFSEKIIVLLLTVDGIEGVDVFVRGAKRSMVDELEAMLDVVDPRPPKSLSMKRRALDMPDGLIQSGIAVSVAKVVEALGMEEDESSSGSTI